VSRRVTLRAEAGERAGLDLIFTFAFDGVRKK
jgi:translocation and assembly module TamB